MSTTTWTLRQHRPHGMALLALLILVGMLLILVFAIGVSIWQQVQPQAVAPVSVAPPVHDEWYLEPAAPASVSPPLRDDWARSVAPVAVSPPLRDDWARSVAPASINPPLRDDWARSVAPASVNPPLRDDWARK